ncbi:hypothetical protein [Streptomyces sp. 7N604]|uniref:hypothetical protein n=1 Tax=Streptomyces sp. 7N604 TaxID=3457415 RepID=UPI003FD0257E
MSLNRSRKIAGLAALVVSGVLLTGCNPFSDEPDAAGTSKAAASSVDSPESDSRADGVVTGTLTYMAPGKLEVDGRPFYVAEDTEIWGSGLICGDPAGQALDECTAEELEAAAKKGGAEAEVEIQKGTAVKVTDQYRSDNPSEVDEGHVAGADGGTDSSENPAGTDRGQASGADGGNDATADNRADGTVTGTLTYMAPGKLEVDGRPFYVAEDTEVWGAGDICGDGEGHVADECTVEELEAAAKKGGVTVAVDIKKGVANVVREQ